MHMEVADVEQAARDFEALRVLASSDIIDTLVNTEAIRAIDGVSSDIREARRAVRFTGAYNRDGDPIYERDFPLTLEAIKTARELVESVRPKNGGGVAVNVGINNNPNGGGVSHGRSFEAMVRLAEQKRKLELGDGGVQTVDAEIVEDGNDEGIELDDPDDAGLDEDDED